MILNVLVATLKHLKISQINFLIYLSQQTQNFNFDI